MKPAPNNVNCSYRTLLMSSHVFGDRRVQTVLRINADINNVVFFTGSDRAFFAGHSLEKESLNCSHIEPKSKV